MISADRGMLRWRFQPPWSKVTNMRRTGPFALTALAVLYAIPAAAQDNRGEVEQIGERTRAEPPSQIGARSKELAAPQPSERTSDAPGPQLSSPGDGEVRGTQLTGERRQTRPGTQLSRPAQSRQAIASRIGGQDKCDEEARRATAECARVIERRAAEFQPPEETPLSPEQRLLVDQRLRAGPDTAQTASRRLGVSGMPAESIEEQGVAALALGGGARAPTRDEEPAESEETLSAEAQALINAIVQRATGAPPPN